MISADNLSLLVEAIPAKVNPELVVILMAVGALIKHSKKFEKVQNKLIPIILGTISIAITLVCVDTYTIDTVVAALATGVVNAAASVYCHQIGKNIFLKKNNTTDDTDMGSSVVVSEDK